MPPGGQPAVPPAAMPAAAVQFVWPVAVAATTMTDAAV